MFLRLLIESFVRQKRRKALAGVAILLGTTAVTAMLALATTIGDRIHRELAVYGANIVVYPKADALEVKVGGVDVKPSTGGAYLKESDLEKLHGIFWANNITGISPELSINVNLDRVSGEVKDVPAVGIWINHPLSGQTGVVTGAPALHPWWKLEGRWSDGTVVVGKALADQFKIHIGERLGLNSTARTDGVSGITDFVVTGILTTGDASEKQILIPLAVAQQLAHLPNEFSRAEIAARTRPEDAFARLDPDKLSPAQHDIWYCRPYANSIAYQIREAIPGAAAEQVRRVEQTEGTVLSRISGLMWLVSLAALLAAGFAVSAAMATAVLERRHEIGLMRSLGAGKAAIATLFYAESSLLALAAGVLGYLAGSALAFWLGARIFPSDGAAPLFNLVLLPVIVAMAVIVAIAGSTPSIRAALQTDPAATLRGDA